jgi:hypothetical protein
MVLGSWRGQCLLLHLWLGRPGKPYRTHGGAEAGGKLDPRQEMVDQEEKDDAAGLGASVGMEITRFTGGGRPIL